MWLSPSLLAHIYVILTNYDETVQYWPFYVVKEQCISLCNQLDLLCKWIFFHMQLQHSSRSFSLKWTEILYALETFTWRYKILFESANGVEEFPFNYCSRTQLLTLLNVDHAWIPDLSTLFLHKEIKITIHRSYGWYPWSDMFVTEFVHRRSFMELSFKSCVDPNILRNTLIENSGVDFMSIWEKTKMKFYIVTWIHCNW